MSPEQRARALRLADEIEPTTHHPIIYLEKLRSAADLLRELAAEPTHGISMDQAQKIARDCGYPLGHELPASLLAIVRGAK